MKSFEPDFYEDFRCKADACRHSCCLGWEIDVDDESLGYYASVPGKLGRKLRENISEEGGAHFILGSDERCPFLMENGLCELICSLGEESLCDICTEHPRFYNYAPGRRERGLGLCCEKAVELLLRDDEPLEIICTDSDGEESGESEEYVLRGRLLSILSDRSLSLRDRFLRCLKLCGAAAEEPDMGFWADFYLGLERMEEGWTERLCRLRAAGGVPHTEKIRYEKLTAYFIYRHFAALTEEYGPAAALKFCILSTAVIWGIDECGGPDDENIRLYSAEIEYSDENIQLICEKILERQHQTLYL